MVTEGDITKVKSVAVILAAGSSSRMGQSKQLLKVGNESLLRKTIKTIIASEVDKAVVILGSNQQVHQQEIADLPIQAIYNEDWEKGMGSSLRCGIHFVEEQFPSCEAILVTVCDQPLLTADHLKTLIHTFQSEKNLIVASFYFGSPGVPALFDRSMFKELMKMEDRHGAKKIIKDHIASVRLIDFPQGAVDLDTPDDWEKFSQG